MCTIKKRNIRIVCPLCAPITHQKYKHWEWECRKWLHEQAGKLNKTKWLVEIILKYHFSPLFSSTLVATSLHVLLPYALSLWWISPKQIRDAEKSLLFTHSAFTPPLTSLPMDLKLLFFPRLSSCFLFFAYRRHCFLLWWFKVQL